ncbi:MAG: SDR family NAD(P)-dependent oxidoreductase [Roseobacter sp.]
MSFEGKCVVVTGGASGIGKALAQAFKAEGAFVCIADIDRVAAEKTAETCGFLGLFCDVRSEASVGEMIATVEQQLGPVDVFVSNAGVFKGQPSHAASASNADWALNWEVHVMAHVYAARALLPKMLERGDGTFVQMTSAAGLLSQIGDAAYSATKQAAVSFAQSLAIEHGDAGIKVGCVCPQYVATDLLGLDESAALDHDNLLTAAQVAGHIIEGLGCGRFLILPHRQVSEYALIRAKDPERWIKGMRALKDKAGQKNCIDPQEQYRLGQ